MRPCDLTEAQFQEQVVALAGYTGWKVYHTWKSLHSAAGFPDLVLVRPPRVLFVELKRDRVARLTPAQAEWYDALGACPGIERYVWRPEDWDAVQQMLSREEG